MRRAVNVAHVEQQDRDMLSGTEESCIIMVEITLIRSVAGHVATAQINDLPHFIAGISAGGVVEAARADDRI